MKQTSEKLEFQEMIFAGSFRVQLAATLLVTGLFAAWYSGSFLGGLLTLLLYWLIAFFVVKPVEIETITFDKNLGHLAIKRHKLLFAKTAKTKVVKHLQDISGVEIQEMRNSDDNMYRVCLLLESGKRRIPLTSSFSTALENKQKKAEVIANFLDIRNYGIGGFSSQETSSEKLQWQTVEEEILHWETAIKSDPNDPDAHIKLALALISQDKTKNKEQAMGYLKQAEAIFKSQGYDEEATRAAQLYALASWGTLGK
jgi:tetratricopeptide (TPR) repeat protein